MTTTTYFAGGEDTSFTFTGSTVAMQTTVNTFRSGWARGAVSVSLGTTTDPPSPRFTTSVNGSANFAAGAQSTFWVHFWQIWGASGGACTNNAPLFRLLDSSGVARLMVRGAGSGALKISTRNAAGSFTDLVTSASSVLPVGGLNQNAIDFFVNYSNSGAGVVTLYVNGTSVATFTGANTTDAATALAQLDISGCDTGHISYFSEVIVSSANTIGKGLWSIAPVAAGTTQTWTPSTVANINKAVINDTTFISTGANNAETEWTVSASPPSGGWLVDAVVQEARLEVGTSGPQHAEWLMDVNGVVNTTGTITPGNSFSNFSNIWETNPNTSAPFVMSDIVPSSGTFELGLESLA